jgi:uncharacterized protein YybS (DUF2232 family)
MLVIVASLGVAVIDLKIMGIRLSGSHVILLGSLGPILSEILRKSYSIEKTIAYSVVALAVVGCSFLLYYSLSQGGTPWSIIEASVADMVQTHINVYARLGTPAEQLDLIRNNAHHISRIFFTLAPSFFIVGTSFLVWVNILIGKQLFQRTRMWYPDFGNLSTWKIPDPVIWVLIAAGVSFLIPLGLVRSVSINVIVVLLFAYLMQGLSIINFFFEKKQIPRLLRIVGYALIFIQQFLLVLVIGLGLTDIWVNFRKLGKEKQNNKGVVA